MTPVEQQVWDALTAVIDPELNVSVVDLGLIYEVEVDEQGRCCIKMSLTTPGCPLSSFLQNDIEKPLKTCLVFVMPASSWSGIQSGVLPECRPKHAVS